MSTAKTESMQCVLQVVQYCAPRSHSGEQKRTILDTTTHHSRRYWSWSPPPPHTTQYNLYSISLEYIHLLKFVLIMLKINI